VDGVSLVEEFEAELADNLYTIWNRMSSGSYFPPPVRAVQIPKADDGTRVLGVPTVATPCAGVEEPVVQRTPLAVRR
jgi:RNA-directed DNA polymerase